MRFAGTEHRNARGGAVIFELPAVGMAGRREGGWTRLLCGVVSVAARACASPPHREGQAARPSPESTLARVEKRPVDTRAPPEHQSTSRSRNDS
jgi:hypothetical protein